MSFGAFGSFGASPAPAFGGGGGFGAPAASTGFGAPTAAPSFGGFGAPAQAPQQTQSLFGATSQGGGFGAPAFGAQPPQQAASAGAFSLGGGGGFGAPAASTGFGAPAAGGFGAAPQQTQSFGGFGAPAASTGFGAPAAGGFGAPAAGGFGAPAFGAPQQTQSTFGGFGAPAAQPQQSASLFGQTAAPAFGAAPATGGFGLASTTSAGFGGFGAPAGQQPAPQQSFGVGSFGLGATGQQQQQQQPTAPEKGSRTRPFQPLVEETQSKANDGSTLRTTTIYQSITCLPEFQHKTFEELRIEDDELGGIATYQGPVQQQPQQQAGGLFGTASGGFGAPQQTPSLFGAPAAAAPAFGGFGAPAAAPAAGGFGGFGAPAAAPAAGGFGGFGAPAASTGFGGFGAAAPAPAAAAPAFGGFGAAPAAAPAAGGFGGFGAPAAAPAAGAFGAPAAGGFGGFGAPAAAPATGGMFGSTPAPAAGGFGGFGGFGTTPAAAPASAGAFSLGGSAPAATTSLFGAAPAAAPAAGGFGGFGAAAPAATTGGFGFGTAPAAASTGFGGFGAATTAAPAASTGFGGFGGFGAATTGGFGTTTAPATGLFGTASTTAPAAGGFGGFGGFGTTPAATAPAAGGFGGFSLGGAAAPAAAATGGLFGTTLAPAAQPLGPQLVAKVDENTFLASFLDSSAQQISKTAVGLSQSQAMMGSTAVGALGGGAGQFAGSQLLVPHNPATPRMGAASNALAHTPRSAAHLRPRAFLTSPSPMRGGGVNSSMSLSLYGGSSSGINTSVNMSLGSSFLAPPTTPQSQQVALTPELLVSRRNLRKLSHIPLPEIVDLGIQDEKTADLERDEIPVRIQALPPSSASKNNASAMAPSSYRNTNAAEEYSVYPSLDRDRSRERDQAPVLKRDTSRMASIVMGMMSPAGQAAVQQRNSALTKDDRAALPTLARSSYYTSPSLTELSLLTREQLTCVSNFTVHHASMGSVSWEGLTDVTDLNLDELVLFERNEKTGTCSVEVYPLGSTIPPAGQKLNKPAIITVKQCWPAGYLHGHANEDDEASEKKLRKYEKKLRQATERAAAEFLRYEAPKGTWSFRVQCFS